METSRGLLDLMIARIPGTSGREKICLAESFSREEDFSALSFRDLYALVGKKPPERTWTMDSLRGQAERDRRVLERNGIGMARFRDAAYPPLLREIYDPPAQLFYRGFLPGLPDDDTPGDMPGSWPMLLAIVGTRKPTGSGQVAVYDAARFLGRNGLAVVSGLALGTDAVAHRGNLAGGGKTIAVLGSGPDRVYPASNRDLARRILIGGGAIVSEYPPGTEPYRWNFPARNRIIAGMARGVIIAEAPEISGALITARFALEADRDLWVLQAAVDSPQGGGARRLAGQGAPVIQSAAAVLEEWGMEAPAGEPAKHKNDGQGQPWLANRKP